MVKFAPKPRAIEDGDKYECLPVLSIKLIERGSSISMTSCGRSAHEVFLDQVRLESR